MSEQEHSLTASGERTVDAKLEVGQDGIVAEEVVNVGAPSPVTEEYHCECGADFGDWNDAKEHILELA